MLCVASWPAHAAIYQPSRWTIEPPSGPPTPRRGCCRRTRPGACAGCPRAPPTRGSAGGRRRARGLNFYGALGVGAGHYIICDLWGELNPPHQRLLEVFLPWQPDAPCFCSTGLTVPDIAGEARHQLPYMGWTSGQVRNQGTNLPQGQAHRAAAPDPHDRRVSLERPVDGGEEPFRCR